MADTFAGWRNSFCICDDRTRCRLVDATNIQSEIRRDGADYVVNGHKWWTSGANDPRCKILIFMGKTDPDNEDRYREEHSEDAWDKVLAFFAEKLG